MLDFIAFLSILSESHVVFPQTEVFLYLYKGSRFYLLFMFLLSYIVFEMSGFFLSDSLCQLLKADAYFIAHPSELGDDFFRCPRERIGVVKADV